MTIEYKLILIFMLTPLAVSVSFLIVHLAVRFIFRDWLGFFHSKETY